MAGTNILVRQKDLIAGTGISITPDTTSGNVTIAATSTAIDESRLLPKNPVNGDIPCFDATATVGGGNDANTRILLHFDADEIKDEAAGNAAPVTITKKTGTITVVEGGKWGKCAKYVTGSMTVATNLDELNANNWVVSGWFNPDENNHGVSYPVWLSMDDSSTNGFFFDSTGRYGESDGPLFYMDTPPASGTWHWLAIVKYSGGLRFYLNGAFLNEISAQQRANFCSTLAIGGFAGTYAAGSTERTFSGLVDEVRLQYIPDDEITQWTGTSIAVPDAPYSKPQTVGEWGKFNKSELAMKSELTAALTGKVNQSELAAYQKKSEAFSGQYSDLAGKPSTFPPAAHTHTIANVTDLQATVNKAHEHANKATLDKLAEADGKLTYDGAEIGGSGTVKSVNGQLPDESGNVTVETGGAVDESRLLPTGGKDGDILGYQEGGDRGNGADVRLLLQNAMTDSANGNAAPAAVTTQGVTLTGDNNLLFDGNDSHVTAVLATDEIFAADKEWTIDFWMKPTANSSDWNYILTENLGDWGSHSIGLTWHKSTNVLEQDTGGYVASVIKAPNWPNNSTPCAADQWHFVAVEKQKTASGWNLNYYLNGAIWLQVAFTADFVPFDASDNPFWFGGKTTDSGRWFKGEVNKLRVTMGARYGGKAFAVPDRLTDYAAPAGQPVWKKGIDRSRLLPENPVNGDIPCFDATATIGGGNDANTRLLLQPSTSDHGIVDQAAGNAAPVTLENHNVTVDEEGNMVFDGSNAYLKIPANTLPSDFFNGTDEWTLDIVYNVASKSMQCLFGCSSSLRMDFLLDSDGSLQIGAGPNLGTGWPFNEDVHLTFEIYKDGTVWKYTIFRNGSVVTTGTWVNADWRSVAQYIGWEGESDSRKINGKIKALRLTSGALHKGAAFQSDYPWTKPQTVGEWGKINKSELALKTDLANKADKTALLGKADKSQLSAYQPLLPVEKQLPAAVNEDELIMSKITTSTVPGANNETVKFLLQPATSNNQVVDSAAGNETPLTFTNNGVTADSDGIMTFSPTQYAVIPAGTVTAGLIDILLNIPTVPDDNVEYVLFGNGPDSNSGGDGFYVCLRGGTLYLCSGNGNVDSLGSYTANTWVNITLGYNGPTANADRNIGYWLNGAGHTVNWNTAGHTYSYNPFSHDFYLGKTDQSSTGLTWKAKVVRLRNTVADIPWYLYNDTTTITVDDYPYQETVQQTKKSWVRSTVAQLEAKMSVATTLEDGLMAAADKAAIAGLTARGIYPNALAKSGTIDFNEIIDHGFYFIGGDFPHLNYPETYRQNGGTLQVIRNGNYLTQTFIPLNINKAFVRSCLNALSDSSERTFSVWRRPLIDTDITESKARPGYFKLHGGMIVQWGAVLNITADGTTSVTLPIAFPNSAFVATATATGSGLITSAAFDGNSKLNVIVKGYPGSGSFAVYWIAIGY